MGYRAHVQTKHEIEYGGEYFNWSLERIVDWLGDNGVYLCDSSSHTEDGCAEWEISKDELRNIPESAYADIPGDNEYDGDITAQELRDFVKELLDAPTGDYAYVSWF